MVNEDSYLLNNDLGLYAVFDGMGGHAAGEVASRCASEALGKYVLTKKSELKAVTPESRGGGSRDSGMFLRCVEEGVISACKDVFQHAVAHPECAGMGTTAAVLLVRGMRGAIATVGDSRVYRIRGQKIEQLSRDHTIVQELIDQGVIPASSKDKSPYKHVLSRVLGHQETVRVDVVTIDLIPGDKFLLCSDGVSDPLKDNEILRLASLEPQKAVESLVKEALSMGGADDRTALLVCIDTPKTISPVEKRYIEQITLTNEVLQRTRLFADLTNDERIRVIERCYLLTKEANEFLMREGEPGDSLFVILRGVFEISRGGKTIARLADGNHVGEMALLSGGVRSADVRALNSADLLCLKSTDFQALVQQEPRIGVKLTLALAKELSVRLGAMNQREDAGAPG